MAFRDSDGNFLGNDNNYEYSGRDVVKPGGFRHAYSKFMSILLVIVFWGVGLFLIYFSFYREKLSTEQGKDLIAGVFFIAFGIFLVFRIRRNWKAEKAFEEELNRIKDQDK